MALVLTETPRSNSAMIPGVKETHEEEERKKKQTVKKDFTNRSRRSRTQSWSFPSGAAGVKV